MGLFFNRSANKGETLSVKAYDNFILQNSYRGIDGNSYIVTDSEVFRNSSVFSAVNMLSSDLARMDINHIVGGELVDDSNLSYILNKEPIQGKSAYKFWKYVYANVFYTGNSYVLISRDNNGLITGLNFVRSSDVEVIKTERGVNISHYQVRLSDKSKVITVRPEDMLHLYYVSEDGITGFSMLETLYSNINNQKNANKYVNSYFKNGKESNLILKVNGVADTTGEKLKNAQKVIYNVFSGEPGLPRVIDERFEVIPTEINSDIYKLIMSTDHDTIAISRVLRIPKDKLNLDNPHSNNASTAKEYQVTTLSSYASEIESELNLKLVHMRGEKNTLLRMDLSVFDVINPEFDKEFMYKAYNSGAISMDEFRKYIGFNELGNEIGKSHFKSNQEGILGKREVDKDDGDDEGVK